MGDLNLILFISFAAPMLMTLIVCRGKTRTLLFFLLSGMAVCLLCGELNTAIMNVLPFDRQYYICNFSPMLEEVLKALPILVYAFLFKPKKRILLESSVLVGVGFAILESASVLGGAASSVSVSTALFRGFGAGMMHAICTLTVGYGMTFVHTRRKLFYTGTVALLTVSMIYHSIYNTLVLFGHQFIGFLLPVLTFTPVFILLSRAEEENH